MKHFFYVIYQEIGVVTADKKMTRFSKSLTTTFKLIRMIIENEAAEPIGSRVPFQLCGLCHYQTFQIDFDLILKLSPSHQKL